MYICYIYINVYNGYIIYIYIYLDVCVIGISIMYIMYNM